MINKLKIYAEQTLKNKVDSVIKGIWNIECLFQPNNQERVFDCKFIISQTSGNGCAYYFSDNFENDENFNEYIGKDFFDLEIENPALNVAIIDSMFAGKNIYSNSKHILNGSAAEKINDRSKIIVNEVLNIVQDRNTKVVNIGAVGDIIREIKKHQNLHITATDLDPQIINKSLHGTKIRHGKFTLDEISNSDVAIITGMAIMSGQLEEIIKVANESGCKIIIYAETGANLIDFYFNQGIDVIISETFPFYIFHGSTEINVYRNELNHKIFNQICYKCNGKCCKTTIFLTESEFKRLSKKKAITRNTDGCISLTNNYSCPFLAQSGCTLQYSERPLDCRIFPLSFSYNENGIINTFKNSKCEYFKEIPEYWFNQTEKEVLTELKTWQKEDLLKFSGIVFKSKI